MVDRHHPGKAPTAILRALGSGSCLTIDRLAADLNLTRDQVSAAASCLFRRDYLMRMSIGCYQLTDAGMAAVAAGEEISCGIRGPRKKVRHDRNTLRERAWRAMRIRRRFTIADLVSDAATSDDGNPAKNIGAYLSSLAQAGYVRVLPNRIPGTTAGSNGFKRYMLARDTGPLAPVRMAKSCAMHDFNTGEDVPCCKPR